MRALASTQPVRDVVMGVHRPNKDSTGRHVWLSVTAVPLRSPMDGSQIALTVFSVLAGPRVTELRLMESEASFRFLAENSSDMVAWQRFDTTFLWVSPASAALLGRFPEQLIGTRSIDLVHPDDVSKVVAAQRQVAAGIVHTTGGRRMLHADGRYVWVETSARIAEGLSAITTQMQTSSRNVDDRIAAHHARPRAEGEPRQRRRLFRTDRSTPRSDAILDLDGLIVEGQRRACTCWDCMRLRPQRVGLSWNSPIPTTSPAAVRRAPSCCRAGPRRTTASAATCDRWVRCWVQATSVCYRSTTWTAARITQMQDITAAKDAIEQLTGLAVTDSLTGFCRTGRC